MDWKKLKPEHKLLLAILFLGLIAGAYYFGIIMDTDDKLSAATNELNRLTKEKAKYKDFEGKAELEKLKDQYARVLRKIEENKKVLPEEEQLAEFINSLEEDAKEAGIRILKYEPEPPIPQNFYNEIPVYMEVRGSYVQLIHFMKMLSEEGSRLVNVDNIELAVQKKKKTKKKATSTSPFGGAAPKQDTIIIAKFTAKAFTYTGSQSAGSGKKRRRNR